MAGAEVREARKRQLPHSNIRFQVGGGNPPGPSRCLGCWDESVSRVGRLEHQEDSEKCPLKRHCSGHIWCPGVTWLRWSWPLSYRLSVHLVLHVFRSLVRCISRIMSCFDPFIIVKCPSVPGNSSCEISLAGYRRGQQRPLRLVYLQLTQLFNT